MVAEEQIMIQIQKEEEEERSVEGMVVEDLLELQYPCNLYIVIIVIVLIVTST